MAWLGLAWLYYYGKGREGDIVDGHDDDISSRAKDRVGWH
jgi:hypothetical protein